MLFQQSCTCTQTHSYCNVTANRIVGHDCEVLLFLGQNAFNFVKKTTVLFRVRHGIQTKYIVCATSVPCNYLIIKHIFAEHIWSPFCSTVYTYIQIYIHTYTNSVKVDEISYCGMMQSIVETQSWWILWTCKKECVLFSGKNASEP